jgi:hypothetical protein
LAHHDKQHHGGAGGGHHGGAGGGHHGDSHGHGGGDHGSHYRGDARDHRHEGGHDERFPFLWGVQEQYTPITAIAVTPGLKIPSQKIPKNGYAVKLRLRYVGNANVTAAGSAGTPSILNLVNQYIISYNGGFAYRNMDGESLYVKNLCDTTGPDTIMGGAMWKNYNPASATNQTIGFMLEDYIALNPWANADKYLLAAHARNTDVMLDLTFGTAAQMAANTETATISGTLYVEGMFFLDPPDYDHFQEPDLDKVQQVTIDTSYTNVVIGDNTVPIVPINGPKYLRLAFKCVFNNVPDTQGYASNVSNIQLKLNNGLNRYYISSQGLLEDNMILLNRIQCGTIAAPNNAPLPPGWYLFDWINDTGVNNQISVAGRNVISTEDIGALWLIVTVAAGTTLTANNQIKLIKQVELPAVGGTSKLTPPMLSGRGR